MIRAIHKLRRLPVVDGDRMVGMVTADDVLLRLFDNLSDVLVPITEQIQHPEPEPVPAFVQ